METVQLKCGSCMKLMAIGVEHLGGQVQCPHCKSVVQTPAPEQPAPAMPGPDAPQRESIFSDDGAAEEGPSAKARSRRAQASADDDESALPTFKPRPVYDRSLLPVMGLIFLVPYALFATVFIAYLLFMRPSRPEPLEYLRDPPPGKKVMAPEHDTPLGPRLRTTLNKPIQAGDLLITPQHIRLTPDGNLQLVLHAKNTAANNRAFEPIHSNFVKLDANAKERSYSFVEAKAKNLDKIFGMDLAFHRDAEAKTEWTGSTTLEPTKEITISLTTYERYKNTHVPTILKSGEDYTWRVQVRRGFVNLGTKEVSATMVIGVDFNSAEIEGKKS